jgi:hypothetical protein
VAERSARREKLAVSGGILLSAAFQFLGELLPAPSDSSESKSATNVLAATLKQSLTDLVEQDDQGRARIAFALPDATALDGLNQLALRLSTTMVSSSAAGMGPRNISTHESRASPALSGSSTGTVDAIEANWSEPSWRPAASLDSLIPSVYRTNRSPGLSCMAVCVYGVPAINPSGRSATSFAYAVEWLMISHLRSAARYHKGGT